MSAIPVLTEEVKLGKMPANGSQERILLMAFMRGERMTVGQMWNAYRIYAGAQRVSRLRNKFGWAIQDEWHVLPAGYALHAKRVKVYFL